MASMPNTRYAKNGDVHIAYQVIGKAPLDLVLALRFATHVEARLGGWPCASARASPPTGSRARCS